MNNAEIQAHLQILKVRLEAESFTEDRSSADLLLICADLLLLIDQIKNNSYNALIKRKAFARILECQVELDSYHEYHATIAPYATVPLKEAGKRLEQAIRLLLFSFT